VHVDETQRELIRQTRAVSFAPAIKDPRYIYK